MPAGSILSETQNSYIVNDGAGNVSVVPKSAIDPAQYGYRSTMQTPQDAAQPAPSAPMVPEEQAPQATQSLGAAPRGTGIGSVMPPVITTPPPAPNVPEPPPIEMPNVDITPPSRARAAAPQQPMTPEQMQAMGTSRELQAIEAQKQVAGVTGDIESQQAAQNADVIAKRNDAVLAEQQAQAAQKQVDAQEYAKISDQYRKALDASENYRIDPNRRYANMSTGTKVGTFLFAALSGIGDALQHKNGPNPVLQMMDAELAKDVNQQLDERAQLEKRAGRMGAQVDKFAAAAKDRQEAFNMLMARHYKNAADEIEHIAAKTASPLAQARAAQQAAQFDEKAGQYIGAAADRAWQQQQAAKQMAQQERMHRESLGVQYAQLNETRKAREWQQEFQKDQLALEAAKLDQAGKAAQAKQVQELGLAGNYEMVTDPKTGEVKPANVLFRNSDGSAWTAPTKEIHKEIYDAKNATDNVVQLIDNVVSLGGGSEWMSDTAKSEKWQRIQTMWAEVKAQKKDINKLGALSDSDYKLLDGMIGSKDPTKIQDSIGGIKQFRENALNAFNHMMSNAQYTGKPYAPPDPSLAAKPEQTAIDKQIALAGASPTGYGASYAAGGGGAVRGAGEDAQVAIIKNLESQFATANPQDKQAIFNGIANLAQGAASEAAKTAAMQALHNLATANIGQGVGNEQAGEALTSGTEARDQSQWTPQPGSEAWNEQQAQFQKNYGANQRARKR